MKHETTRELYRYWTTLRGNRIAPARFEVDPAAIRHLLADAFILEAASRREFPFRLAGTRVCTAYCRELKGRNFLDMWTGKDREALTCLLAAIVEEGAAAVAGFDLTNMRGQTMTAEMIFLPLSHDGPYHTRILGAFAPLKQPYWMGLVPIERQPIHSLRLIWPDEQANLGAQALARTQSTWVEEIRRRTVPPRLAARALLPPGKKIGHLMVFEGGQA